MHEEIHTLYWNFKHKYTDCNRQKHMEQTGIDRIRYLRQEKNIKSKPYLISEIQKQRKKHNEKKQMGGKKNKNKKRASKTAQDRGQKSFNLGKFEAKEIS